MEPAQSIIKAFGGEREVARLTGTSYTAPYRWQAAREQGGTAGRIPQKRALKLLEHARQAGIPVTAEDFLADQVRAEVTAYVVARQGSGEVAA